MLRWKSFSLVGVSTDKGLRILSQWPSRWGFNYKRVEEMKRAACSEQMHTHTHTQMQMQMQRTQRGAASAIVSLSLSV